MKIIYFFNAVFYVFMIYCMLPLSSREFLIQIDQDMRSYKEDVFEEQLNTHVAGLEGPPNCSVLTVKSKVRPTIVSFGDLCTTTP